MYQQTKIHPLAFGALALGGVVALGAFLNSRGKVREPEIENYIGEETRKHLQANQGIREHMEVVGADGAHVGTVDGMVADQIKLTRKDSADGRHHFISTNLIESIEQDKVILKRNADEIRDTFRNEGGGGSLTARA